MKISGVAALAFVLVWLAGVVGIIWTAVHFIHKLW